MHMYKPGLLFLSARFLGSKKSKEFDLTCQQAIKPTLMINIWRRKPGHSTPPIPKKSFSAAKFLNCWEIFNACF